MRERWPLSIVGEGLRPARLAPPQVWAELPLKRCHAQAVRAAMLLRLRQEPPTTQAAVIRDPSNNFRNWPVGRNPGGVTPSLGVELTPVDVRDASAIEHSIAGLTCGSNSGLIVTISPLAFLRRELIIALAARHRLPAVYAIRVFVADGGLMSYGPDEIEQHRRAAGYVDRILRGEKPADLPVQRRPNTNW
jgi:putative tryptophan/tyrosine transport system substrate-binding protein